MVGRKRFRRLIKPIVQADKVWVMSGETSQAGAMAFHSRLSMVRPNVTLLQCSSLSTYLSSAGHGDVAVIFDFYR